MLGFACGTLNIFSFQVFENLSKFFPHFQIQWEEDNNQSIIEKLLKENLDFAFVIGNHIPNEVEKFHLFSTSPQVIVYEGHPFFEREFIYIKDLINEPIITLNEKFHTYHGLIQRCHDFGFSPNIIAKTMESPLIYRFVQEKHGIGIDVDIHNYQAFASDIKQIPLLEAFSWNIEIIYKKDKKDIYPIDALCAYFEDNLK